MTFMLLKNLFKSLLVVVFMALAFTPPRAKADDPQPTTTSEPTTDDGSEDTDYAWLMSFRIQA